MEKLELQIQQIKVQLQVQSLVLGLSLAAVKQLSPAGDQLIQSLFAGLKQGAAEFPEIETDFLAALAEIERATLQTEPLQSPSA